MMTICARQKLIPLLLCLTWVTTVLGDDNSEEHIVNGKKFAVPKGCTIELVAGSPLIDRPINCDFDDQGRLYVTESSGTNENVNEQLRQKPHRIVRLEDTDADGVFDKKTIFADKMMFPEGAMWFDGSLYVCAPPQIWKLTDTNDDGVADRREVWFDGKTLTGCANDLHGPYLGPDGWIYWSKGAFAQQEHNIGDQKKWTTRASHIFRRRPEGGIVEPVMTGGMDNPVELVFTPEGERIFNSTFLHHPHDGKRDGLVHAIYGGVYGKDHGVLEGHPRTGDLMPVLVDQDASAPSGLVRLESAYFGDPFQNNILCSSFNMHKVFRHRLVYSGSLLKTANEDFVVCHDLDFHPTDVIEDADGSVLIVDTGGWYKLCCPTSQLHKPDVLGGIYRVGKKQQDTNSAREKSNGKTTDAVDHWGREIDWTKANPLSFFDDERFVVRRQAIRIAAKQNRVKELIGVLKLEQSTGTVRQAAVWALCRIDSPEARAGVCDALGNTSSSVRQVAAHAASVWRDAKAVQALCRLLRLRPARNRRVAAEALGRIRDPRAVLALLQAAASLKIANNRVVDRGLEHSLIYALIQIRDASAIHTAVLTFGEHCPVPVKHVAAMALAEIGAADKKMVLDLARSPHPFLQKTGWSILLKHPEWASEMAGYFRDQFRQRVSIDESRLSPVINQPAILSEVLRAIKNDDPEKSLLRVQLLNVIKQSRPALTKNWKSLPLELLSSDNRLLLQATVDWIKSTPELRSNEIDKRLLEIARNGLLPPATRMNALAICKNSTLSDTEVREFHQYLTVDHSVSMRALAVEVFQNSKLSDPQRTMIASKLNRIGTGELPAVLKLLRLSNDNNLQISILDALQKSKFILAMDPEKLKGSLGSLAKADSFQPLLEKISRRETEDIQRMDKILKLIPKANIRRGQKIFHSNQASCIACHQMGYLGGRIGPSLSRIGRIRSERDLLEALMFPSLSFVRSYEPVIVATTDGKQFSGVVKNETSSFLELTLDAQKTIRIKKSEIENRRVGTQSIMPTGLDKEYSDQELADLIRFLKESG